MRSLLISKSNKPSYPKRGSSRHEQLWGYKEMEMSVQQALEQLVEKGHVEFGGMRFTTNLATNMGSFWVKGESGKEGPFEELITHVWDFANSVYCELTDHDVARVSLD